VTVKDAERIAGLTRSRVVPTSDLVERLRAVKSPEEVAAIRAAAELAQDALAEVLPTVRVGQTEQEIGAALEAALRRRGSEWHPFPTIVASGPRSALPHARTSSRAVQRGEWLLLDFGAQVAGTAPTSPVRWWWGRVTSSARCTTRCAAQGRALAHLRPGTTGRSADASRGEIAGRGSAGVRPSLGHGGPRSARGAAAGGDLRAVPPHTVVTVEPGVYFPGWGGVRLEDDLYLGDEGPELLSDGRTELVELV
jgi:Xaa-Pro aminopeptidase